MMKRKCVWLVCTLAVLLMCCFLPGKAQAATVDSGICGENLTWTLDDQGTLTISGTGDMSNGDPWLGTAPLYPYHDSVCKVVIDNGVTSIGSHAFYLYSNLTSITIPESVTTIGDSAFYECSSLISVTIPDSVTSIGDHAFDSCRGLTSITIPDSVTSIGEWAFYSCNSLTSVVIPDNVTTIGDLAFYMCEGLTSVTIPDSVTSIGDDAFHYCSSLTGIWVSDNNPAYSNDSAGALYNKDKTILLKVPGTISGSYAIPNSVASIEGSAFFSCNSLTDVSIPGNVTSIGDWAFFSCSGLTSVTIPDSVVSIGDSAFGSCSSLTSVTIPDSVISIGDDAFTLCSGLTAVKIPDGVTKIGDGVFWRCSSLSSVTIPHNVTSIGDSAFSGCGSLTSITIPDDVKTIGEFAFYCCNGLTSVTIPDDIASIGDSAFSGCGCLTDVYYSGTTDQWAQIAIGTGNDSLLDATIHPIIGPAIVAFGVCGDNLTWTLDEDDTLTISGTGAMKDYTTDYTGSDNPWHDYRSQIKKTVIGEGVTGIGANSFWFCDNLTEVVIPESAIQIGYGAFNCCYSLTTVMIPASVTSIGEGSFAGCTNLTGIWVSDNNAYYSSDGMGVLYNKDKTVLKKAPGAISGHYDIPDSVISISEAAFENCDSLTGITIPCSVTSIGWFAFLSCDNLTSVTIPESVSWLGGSSFSGCINLTTITIPHSITGIGYDMFSNCTSLATVTIPDGVTSIGNHAFGSCSSLTSVTIPDSVISIGDVAFSFCSSLTSITIPDSVRSIGEWAFYSCNSLTSVLLPNSLLSIGDDAFDGCDLNSVTYCGTEEQWNAISIGDSNEELIAADRKYHDYACATCITPKTCTLCGNTEGTALGHSWEDVTCTTPKTCSVCGSTEGEPLGHSGGVWFEILLPTCTETGIKARICDACGDTETINIDALGHSYEAVVTAPTCAEQGYTTNTCAVCGDVTVTDYVAANGHSYDAVVTAPTCTEQGYTTNTCTVCADVTVTDYVDAKGHKWSAWIQTKAPSCNAEGSQVRFCNCGVRETQTIARLTHTIGTDGCTLCGAFNTYHWVLTADATVQASLGQDLYVDLNGYDLSGVIILNSYKIYGIDSATDGYVCEEMGYFSCVDENGNAIVPERHFKGTKEQIGAIKRYMTIPTENGYTFHRFYLGVTHMSLKPGVIGFGYKAVFAGDDMVKAQLDENEAFGYSLQLEGFDAVSAFKSRDSFVSGKAVALRLNDYDVDNYGQTSLSAKVLLKLSDGTVIESGEVVASMRHMLESLNSTMLTPAQLTAIRTMIEKYPIIKSWDTESLYA